MSTAIITAAIVPAMLDSMMLMNCVAVIIRRAPPIARSGSSRNPASAMHGKTIHRTSITFERAKPIQLVAARRRVGLGGIATSQNIARKQIVEIGLDEADPSQPTTGGQRALDREVKRRYRRRRRAGA